MALNKCNPKMRAKDPELKKREKKIPKTSKCGSKKSHQSFNCIRSARKPKMNDKEFGRDNSKHRPRAPETQGWPQGLPQETLMQWKWMLLQMPGWQL